MRVADFRSDRAGERLLWSASVTWEDRPHPASRLSFELDDTPRSAARLPADAFLLATFAYAATNGERRVAIDAAPCPMLVEGLHTAHAWWREWGLVHGAMPVIETQRPEPATLVPRRQAVAFLSGGVDSLHMLRRNRLLYRPDDPAYVREAILVHGFDIGKKKKRGPERAYFAEAKARLRPLTEELGVSLVTCSSDLRQLPSRPGAWLYQQHGAALAAVGHAVTLDPGFLFLAATYDVPNMSHWGSHPALDVNFSSQRLTIVHDGARFSRLDKVRELAAWPTALANLRVCTENPATGLNCGECEKCIRTRLELLAAGIEATPALGDSAVPVELLERAITIDNLYQASCFAEVVAPILAGGRAALADAIETKLADFRRRRASSSPPRARKGRVKE